MKKTNKVKGLRRVKRLLSRIADTIDIGDYVEIYKHHNQYKVITHYFNNTWKEPYIICYEYWKGIYWETYNYLKQQ